MSKTAQLWIGGFMMLFIPAFAVLSIGFWWPLIVYSWRYWFGP